MLLPHILRYAKMILLAGNHIILIFAMAYLLILGISTLEVSSLIMLSISFAATVFYFKQLKRDKNKIFVLSSIFFITLFLKNLAIADPAYDAITGIFNQFILVFGVVAMPYVISGWLVLLIIFIPFRYKVLPAIALAILIILAVVNGYNELVRAAVPYLPNAVYLLIGGMLILNIHYLIEPDDNSTLALKKK